MKQPANNKKIEYRVYDIMTARWQKGRKANMATGKKAKDIFTWTANTPKVGLGVKPRVIGRPKANEPYYKVTVSLYQRHILLLEKIALAIREKTGTHVARADLIRALIDKAAPDPKAKTFEKAVRELLGS